MKPVDAEIKFQVRLAKDFAKALAETDDTTTIGILDALAIAGFHLTTNTDRMVASEAYMWLLTQDTIDWDDVDSQKRPAHTFPVSYQHPVHGSTEFGTKFSAEFSTKPHLELVPDQD